jgi:hypothetical protein
MRAALAVALRRRRRGGGENAHDSAANEAHYKHVRYSYDPLVVFFDFFVVGAVVVVLVELVVVTVA